MIIINELIMSQSINIFVTNENYSIKERGPFNWSDIEEFASSRNDKPLLFYLLLSVNTQPIPSFQNPKGEEREQAVMGDYKAGVNLVFAFFDNLLKYDVLTNASDFKEKYKLFKEHINNNKFDKKYFLLDGDLYWDDDYYEDIDGLLEYISFFGQEVKKLNQIVIEVEKNGSKMLEGKKILDITKSNLLKDFRTRWDIFCCFEYFQ